MYKIIFIYFLEIFKFICRKRKKNVRNSSGKIVEVY